MIENRAAEAEKVSSSTLRTIQGMRSESTDAEALRYVRSQRVLFLRRDRCVALMGRWGKRRLWPSRRRRRVRILTHARSQPWDGSVATAGKQSADVFRMSHVTGLPYHVDCCL